MSKDFWRSSRVVVLGGGNFGTVLAQLASERCREVVIYVRDEAQARAMNATRVNSDYLKNFVLAPNILTVSEPQRIFEQRFDAMLWCLPAAACREAAKVFAPAFKGDEILIHATKGIEENSLKRISEVLAEEIPCPRIGVLSGPNLASELALGEPAATVIASHYPEVVDAGIDLFHHAKFRVYRGSDVVGVEWAGTLKNIYAIASGALNGLGFGMNAKAFLVTRSLAEMAKFAISRGAKERTFMGLAGFGDLMATCLSPASRNFTVGSRLGKGEPLATILDSMNMVAEGVRTTSIIVKEAKATGVSMPIAFAVQDLIEGKADAKDGLISLLNRAPISLDH